MENSIAIFILYKNIRKGRKTFARYTLISVACTDILSALLYYPAEFVRFKHGEFFWLVQGHTGNVLCNLYSFLIQIPGKVLVFCLVALACDVTRNLSSKGRREHTREFSAILILFFWLIAAGPSSMNIVISKVEFKICVIDPAKYRTAAVINFIHSYMLVLPANLTLTILNLVIYYRVRRIKKEITRKQKVRKAGRMKVHRQRKRNGDHAKNAEAQQLTDEAREMLSSKSCEPGGVFPQQMSTRTKTFNGGSDSGDVDVVEEDQSATEESFGMTREEAKIESATSSIFAFLSIIVLILPYICDGPGCSEYVFFTIQIAANIHAVIKPGIYAITDKEFGESYKQLSPFACCCFRRIRCHTVPPPGGIRNSLSSQKSKTVCKHTVV